MMSPPSTAPRRFPIPPMTAAVNAISPASNPWKYQMPFVSYSASAGSPPAPASVPPIRNVSEIVVFDVDPPSVAPASGSCAVARWPCRAGCGRQPGQQHRGRAPGHADGENVGHGRITTRRFARRASLPGEPGPTPLPARRRATAARRSRRMNENPTAVVSGASLGALRSGR